MIKEINNEEHPIGSKVLSMEFGIGVISSVEKLKENGDDYYVIEYGKKNAKNYFPVDNNKNLRFVSSKKEFERALNVFAKEKSIKKITSKKERQLYFDRPLKKSDIKLIATRLLELTSVLDLTPREKKICDRLIETLELEASIIFKMKLNESKEFISTFLNKNN